MAGKRSSGRKSRITGKQRVARVKNIEIARKAKKKSHAGGTKSRPTSARTKRWYEVVAADYAKRKKN